MLDENAKCGKPKCQHTNAYTLSQATSIALFMLVSHHEKCIAKYIFSKWNRNGNNNKNVVKKATQIE